MPGRGTLRLKAGSTGSAEGAKRKEGGQRTGQEAGAAPVLTAGLQPSDFPPVPAGRHAALTPGPVFCRPQAAPGPGRHASDNGPRSANPTVRQPWACGVPHCTRTLLCHPKGRSFPSPGWRGHQPIVTELRQPYRRARFRSGGHALAPSFPEPARPSVSGPPALADGPSLSPWPLPRSDSARRPGSRPPAPRALCWFSQTLSWLSWSPRSCRRLSAQTAHGLAHLWQQTLTRVARIRGTVRVTSRGAGAG